jgi:hypothetical protein
LAQTEYLQSPWLQDELNNLIYLKILVLHDKSTIIEIQANVSFG